MLGLAFLLLASFAIAPASAASFRDTQGHWAQKTIDRWHEYGVVNGFEGAFRPDEPVTRAEFATMINNIMRYTETGENRFSDLNPSQWYYDTMIKLSAAGVMNGSDGKAMPLNDITRQEAAVLLYKAFKVESATASGSFKDEQDIAGWAADAVKALYAGKVVNGYPDGSFRPTALLSRAEAVTIFNNLVRELISAPGEYSLDVDGNVVVNSPDVTLSNMSISGDLYITQGVGEGEVVLNNVKIDGSVHVFGGGENSIIFNNVAVNGALVVNKYNGKVRIVATGNSTVSVTVLESGALLVTRELTGGGFENVLIPEDVAADQEIVLDGKFGRVENLSESAQITANGTIDELVAKADTRIQGEVEIAKVTVESGVSATLNDSPIEASDKSNDNNGGTSQSGGIGPIGGNPGGGNSGGNVSVPVTSVTIKEKDIVLAIGDTLQLTADISPGNATNKSVSWEVADGSTDVVTVDANGVVTAHGLGTKTIKVVTADGGKTDQTTVTVIEPKLTVSLLKFAGDVIDENAEVEDTVIANSENVSIVRFERAPDDWNRHDALIVAQDALQEPGDSAGNNLYLVIRVQDRDGKPIADWSELKTNILGNADTIPTVGYYLADEYKQDGIVLRLNIGKPERILTYVVTFSYKDYADTSILLNYVPHGMPYVTSIDPIQGNAEIGSKLTAGEVKLEGSSDQAQFQYKWMRADSTDGLYTAIGGATGKEYELTEEDSGRYIRVAVAADQYFAGGFAVSEPFGPVEELPDAEEVFAAIEAKFLGENTDANNIVSNLNLMTSLAEYPGVAIAWTSDQPSVLTDEGVVTRDDKDDKFVQLTATLSGKVTGTKTKTYTLIVRNTGTDNVDLVDFVDPYFAAGYPQAYVQDGNIRVRFKLDEPAEVFMVVNAINGHIESDVKAVLEGRAGKGFIVSVDEWPYFHVDGSEVDQVYDFDTNVSLKHSSARSARVEFVIRDSSRNYVSEKVTTILFDQKTVEALDTYPPYPQGLFINKALDAIYVYFNEHLDLTSVPDVSDFTLNTGTVSSVELHNSSDVSGLGASHVKLGVSGIPAEQKFDIRLSYNGQAIRDTSDAQNKTEAFANRLVEYVEAEITSVTISSDRKSIIAEIVPGWNTRDNTNLNDAQRFAVSVDQQDQYVPSSATFSYGVGHLTYVLKFDQPLPGGQVTVKMNTSGIKDWANDEYPAELVSQAARALAAPGTPVATYETFMRKLVLKFADDFAFDYWNFPAAGLVLKIDNVEYALRGFPVSSQGGTNTLWVNFDSSNEFDQIVINALENGTDIQVKYAKVNGDDSRQLSDAAGALLPDFDYVPVTRQ